MTNEVAPFRADPARNVRATITQGSVERVFTILFAIAALGFGLVDAPAIIKQMPYLDPVWGPVSALVLAGSFLFVGASAFVQRLAQPAQIVCAVLFLVVLVTWPLTVLDTIPDKQVPWPWWLCNVGSIASALGFATWRATVYNAIVPAGYIALRLMPQGGDVGIARAVLDGVYIAILGGAALVLIAVVRRAAASVDAAQATAVRRYSHAIREHATEVERVQVDSIVHDSVLTTLLSAARADTADAKALSARMARNAIDHLAAAATDAPGDVPPVPIRELRARIATAVAALAVPVPVGVSPAGDLALPAAVAEALASAALQAAVNSVQHAGDDVTRWITISASPDGGVTIEIGDDGAGFDVDRIPAERLGVRRSIIERIAAAGGVARIRTVPGAGTRVGLSWPAPDEDDGEEQA